MNFDFSDDQKFLKAEARKFLDARAGAKVNRSVLDNPEKTHDADLWKGVAEMGWLGVAIPEAHGGLGLGHLELCAIAEELGRVVAPIPFASTVYFFAEAIMLAGSETQKAELLPRIASGDLIGCFATSEGPGAVTADSLSTTVENGRINGVKIPVTDGSVAQMAVVLASEGGKPGLFLVDLTGESVSGDILKTVDPSRNAARLTFSGAAAQRLGEVGQGLDLMEAVFDRAAVLLAFEQVGGADKSLEMAKEYALGRYAFGRTIAGYQAIKHKLADVHIAVELARPLVYGAALSLGADSPDTARDVSAAAAAAADAALLSARSSLQAHGAIGFTQEHDLSLLLLRVQALRSAWGDATWHRRRVLEGLTR